MMDTNKKDAQSNVRLALERLTVWDVWSEAPFASGGAYPSKDGVFVSPFKESVNKTPSLSISKAGKRWKDFGDTGPARGVVGWVERCHPDWSKIDVLRWLVERAGLVWHESLEGAPERLSRKDFLKAQREARLRLQRQKEEAKEAAAAAREQALAWPEAVGDPAPASAAVRERWTEGRSGSSAWMARLAESRGWPVWWVQGLFDLDHISCPLLPWSGERSARGVALAVVGVSDELAGYHQVYPRHKSWVFVPHVPKEPRSEFQKALAAEALVVPALPFVLGNPETASVVIVTEGQWDAVTVWGVLDGFECRAPDILVFGIRGVSGVDVWLAHWGNWLRERRPAIWLMPDNDARGRVWFDAEAAKPGVPLEERLWQAGLTVARSLTPAAYGKDFNDFYRSAARAGQSMDADWLRARMQRLGLCGGE